MRVTSCSSAWPWVSPPCWSGCSARPSGCSPGTRRHRMGQPGKPSTRSAESQRLNRVIGSRWRGGEGLLVLGVVLLVAVAGRDDEQVVVHLALGEALSELGDKQAQLQ